MSRFKSRCDMLDSADAPVAQWIEQVPAKNEVMITTFLIDMAAIKDKDLQGV